MVPRRPRKGFDKLLCRLGPGGGAPTLGGKGSRARLIGKSYSGTPAPGSSCSGDQDKGRDRRERCYGGGIPKQDSRDSYLCPC